ncbi:D-ribose pyranase [Bacillus sp. JJ1122]|uniref:D-ribose pyranase n=1 Tax=Bacillus sp. JJ1122 TaxID=3122951 RepID=UPI002FFEC11B
MKKNGVLNSEIANVLARMGHTDYIVIADCGLPIPDETKRIDLALTKGVPSFSEVLTTILDDFVVEKAILALEIKTDNGALLKEIERSGQLNNVEYVTHEEFKNLTKKAKAVIRTGECSPYANIILHSGVIF